MDALFLHPLTVTFGLGLASAASPCLLPLYPAFLAYLTSATGAEDGGWPVSVAYRVSWAWPCWLDSSPRCSSSA